jgi:hypothetical protein
MKIRFSELTAKQNCRQNQMIFRYQFSSEIQSLWTTRFSMMKMNQEIKIK